MLAQQSSAKYAGQQQQQPYGSAGVHYIGAQTIARSSKLHQNMQLMSISRASNGSTFQSYYEPTTANQQQQQLQYQQQLQFQQQGRNSILMQKQYHKQQQESLMSLIDRQSLLNRPLCRCRVMYLGSSVPHITKNGLHGIQEPLKHLYPEEQFTPGNLLVGSNKQQQNGTIDISHLSSSLGIDSWLSVWSNGLLLENVDEFGREIKRFFSIESLHYCAAVRFFDTTTLSQPPPLPAAVAVVPEQQAVFTGRPIVNNMSVVDNLPLIATQLANGQQSNETLSFQNSDLIAAATASGANDLNNNSIGKETKSLELLALEPAEGLARQQRQRKSVVRFLPLDAPLFQCPGMIDANHPPVFAAIFRRTTGIKVLECHAFICRRDAAANALVRCCTQAYADLLNARRLSLELNHYYQQQRQAETLGLDSSYFYGTSGRSRAGRQHKRSSVSGNSYHQQRSSSQPSRRTNGIANGHSAVVESHTAATMNGDTRNDNKSASTTTTTNTSNEDNSLEASSDDNYAIISKHYYKSLSAAATVVAPASTRNVGREQPQQAATVAAPVSAGQARVLEAPTSSGGSSSRRKSRKKAGSSKSLFNDFMPLANDVSNKQLQLHPCCNRQSMDIDKLSQSLDFLQLSDSNNYHTDKVQYSNVVRSKRHSKSMQNLLPGPNYYDFSGSAAAASTCKGSQRPQPQQQQRYSSRNSGGSIRSRTSSTGRRQHQRQSFSEKSRRASSYQDICALELSARKEGSLSSDLTVHSSGSQQQQLKYRKKGDNNCSNNNNNKFYAATCEYGGCTGDCNALPASQQSANIASSKQYRNSLSKLNATANNMCPQHVGVNGFSVAANDDGDEIVRLPDPDECSNNNNSTMVSSSRSNKKVSAKKHGSSSCSLSRSRRRRESASLAGLQYEPPVTCQQKVSKGLYQQAQQQAYKVVYPAAAPLLPLHSHLAPMYMPPAACYLPYQQQHPIYSAGSIYEPVAYLPSATLVRGHLPHHHPHLVPHHHHHHHHNQQQQALGFAAAAGHPFAGQQQPFTAAGIPYHTSYPMATATLGPKAGKSNKTNTKSSSLARFRCLSPPVNFLSPRNSTAVMANSTSKQPTIEAQREDIGQAEGARRQLNQSLQVNRAPMEQQQLGQQTMTTTTTMSIATAATTTTSTKTTTIAANEAQEAVSPLAEAVTAVAASSAVGDVGHQQESEQQIVSAPPGFISSSQATMRRKKMGWIKRLSLTMTAGLSGDESDCGNTANASLSVDPKGGANGQQQEAAISSKRKKRSGLFSGSLTLGRSSRHPKLVTP